MQKAAAVFTLAIVFAATAAVAQDAVSPCKDRQYEGSDRRSCEVRNYTMAAPQELQVDPGMNGGISLTGESRGDVKVEAEVQAWGSSEAEARATRDKVKVLVSGNSLRADGPKGDKQRWSVNFHITAPANMASTLHANNGGISLSGTESTVHAETTNGGLSMSNVGGDIHAKTVNGGISIKLSGTQWNGQGLDAETTNGGIHADIPQDFRAHLEASTVNGGFRLNPPVTAAGKVRNSISTDLNGGGATLRLTTVNGSVSVGGHE